MKEIAKKIKAINREIKKLYANKGISGEPFSRSIGDIFRLVTIYLEQKKKLIKQYKILKAELK